MNNLSEKSVEKSGTSLLFLMTSIGVASALFTYGLWSFVTLLPSPADWSEIGRMGFICMWMVFYIAGVSIAFVSRVEG